MRDLDAQIRAELEDPCCMRHVIGASRAVLDMADRWDLAGLPDHAHEVRTVIARELGIEVES